MQRRCSHCHGPVTLNHATVTIELSDGSKRDTHGLGHWHCVNGCRRRTVTRIRFIGAGKENEIKHGGGYKDEYLRSEPVTRDISVEYGVPKRAALKLVQPIYTLGDPNAPSKSPALEAVSAPTPTS